MDDFNESQGTTGEPKPDDSIWMPPPPASPGPASPGDAPGWTPPPANPPDAAGTSSSEAQPGGPTGTQPGAWAPPPPAWGASPPGWHDPNAGAGASQDNSGWGAAYQDPNGWGDPWASAAQGNPYGAGSGSWGSTNPPPPGAPGWGGGGPSGPSGPSGGWNYPWQNPGSPQPRRTLPGAITALLLAVAVLVGLAIGHGVWRSAQPAGLSTGNGGSSNGGIFDPFGGNSGSGSSGSGGSGGSGSSGSTPSNVGSISAKVAPDLVDINTALSYEHDEAAGTGIVLTSNGVILTNNHVISGATSVSVTDVGNGHTYPGTVVGYDRVHDIAVVQLQGASGLQTAPIGNSSKVSVGDEIVGIGNAGGAGGTPSSAAGTVTALNQSITADDESNGTSEQLTGLIQDNADIQQGDSGGALVNASGQVIGIDTAASSSFQIQNSANTQGFAIPINEALSIAGQIRGGQASSDVHIGPTAFLGVLVDTNSTSGATLSSVVSGGPAANAGLAGGDTITTVGGKTVGSPANLTTIISRYSPGDKVTVGWVDSSGASHQATVELGSGPPQ